MPTHRFFPNRLFHFLLLILASLIAPAPLVLLLNNCGHSLQTLLIYSAECLMFLLLVVIINRRRNVPIARFYTNRLDGLWLALLIVVIIQLFISIPVVQIINLNLASHNSLPTANNPAFEILSSVLLAPIFEESIFRGVLLRGLMTRYSKPISILISSIVFALIHIQPAQILPALILGLLFGVIFVRTHSLIYTIILHSTANAIVQINTHLTLSDFYLPQNTLPILSLILLASLITMYLTTRLHTHMSHT